MPFTGSQAVPRKKPKPNLLMVNREPEISSKKDQQDDGKDAESAQQHNTGEDAVGHDRTAPFEQKAPDGRLLPRFLGRRRHSRRSFSGISHARNLHLRHCL